MSFTGSYTEVEPVNSKRLQISVKGWSDWVTTPDKKGKLLFLVEKKSHFPSGKLGKCLFLFTPQEENAFRWSYSLASCILFHSILDNKLTWIELLICNKRLRRLNIVFKNIFVKIHQKYLFKISSSNVQYIYTYL